MTFFAPVVAFRPGAGMACLIQKDVAQGSALVLIWTMRRLPRPAATLRMALLVLSIACGSFVPAATPPDGEARLEVACERRSAFVNVSINSFRKIGRVRIEVRNAQGLVLYCEEGKALTPELVRRLDKGAFPRGTHAVIVQARDFRLERPFTVD